MPGCPEHHASARLSHQYSRLQRRHEISRSPHTCIQYIHLSDTVFFQSLKRSTPWARRCGDVGHKGRLEFFTAPSSQDQPKVFPHSFPTCFVHLYHVQTPIKHHRGAQFLTHCLSFVSSFKTKPPKTSLQIHYFGWKDHWGGCWGNDDGKRFRCLAEPK